MVREQVGAAEHVLEREQELLEVQRRRHAYHVVLADERMNHRRIAFQARQLVDIRRGPLEAFVFLQATDEFGARIFLDTFLGRWPWQQQPGLDLRENRGHQQVFRRQFQAHHLAHHVDVIHVLPGDLGDRDVENVEVLPADQIQQQVQWTFERFEDDFERVRRNVQVLGHLQHGLPADERERHFLLLRDAREGILGFFDHLDFGCLVSHRHTSEGSRVRPGTQQSMPSGGYTATSPGMPRIVADERRA